MVLQLGILEFTWSCRDGYNVFLEHLKESKNNGIFYLKLDADSLY